MTLAFVTGAGGTVLGNSKYPIGATDYSSLLLAAQASGADVLCLALGGTDISIPRHLSQIIKHFR